MPLKRFDRTEERPFYGENLCLCYADQGTFLFVFLSSLKRLPFIVLLNRPIIGFPEGAVSLFVDSLTQCYQGILGSFIVT